jgi:abortive infection bacteriophage resistance protein
MVITDRARTRRYLARIGYYRLSGYWFPFRQATINNDPTGKTVTTFDDTFVAGTKFSQVVDLYVFDKKLRMLMLDAIERVEVALRVDIALRLGTRDPWAHLNPAELHGNFAKPNPRTGRSKHAAWCDRLSQTLARSDEDFVRRFQGKYASPLPIWIAIEVWNFGMLSQFLAGLKHADQAAIATAYGVPRPELLTSWVRAVNFTRNVCAHHSRLWNRPLVDQPKPPKKGEIPLFDHLTADRHVQSRLYFVAAVLRFFLMKVNPTSHWHERLEAHLATLPAARGISLRHAGFSDGWNQQALWA